MSGGVLSHCSTPEFFFKVREHISCCFSGVERSLPPDEVAVLVLRDIAGMSAREAATVLGISDSVLRHRLSAARTSMTGKYEGLCALVNKQGICHQCRGLQMVAADGKKGGPFPEVPDFALRCAIARTCKSTSMENLHDVF